MDFNNSYDLRTSTRVTNDKSSNILISTPENQVTNSETKHNSHEHPTVKQHDGEHKQVSDLGVEPKQGGFGEPRGGPLGSDDLFVALLQQRVLDLGFRRLSTQYLGAWAPVQNHAAVALAAGMGSIGQRRWGVGAGSASPGKGFWTERVWWFWFYLSYNPVW